jgi:hypothetical protein
MLKNILILKGAQQLSKTEQITIHGGSCIDECGPEHPHECNENQKCMQQWEGCWYCVYKDGPGGQ